MTLVARLMTGLTILAGLENRNRPGYWPCFSMGIRPISNVSGTCTQQTCIHSYMVTQLLVPFLVPVFWAFWALLPAPQLYQPPPPQWAAHPAPQTSERSQMGVVHQGDSSRGKWGAVGDGWSWAWPLSHGRLQRDGWVAHRELHQECVLDTGNLSGKKEKMTVDYGTHTIIL